MEWLWLPPRGSLTRARLYTCTYIQVEALGMKGLLIQNENDCII